AAPDADDAPATAPSPDAPAAPTGPDARKATPSNGAPSIPQTGDSTPALATLLLAAVAASAFALRRARRHLGDPR
ncbi:LPXTG cell wall anchor domain-containing protein, partial [Enterorhabdus sp. P55]|uniref:LPXTG cell wall anchor domain-containing protein n=1 Tax=Enterorhabdus sp. P55 TaxID=2304571 RepID=UPI00136C491E